MTNLLAIVAALIVVIPGAWWVSHTKLVGASTEVAGAWADIDAELQRRHELVPQLVATVSAAAEHERDLLVELTRRNDAAIAAPTTPDAVDRWEPPVTEAIAQVLALRERYPALNSQQNFLTLQRQLATIEDRIAASRRFYNTRVAELNRRIEAFPSAVVARRHGFEPAQYVDLS